MSRGLYFTQYQVKLYPPTFYFFLVQKKKKY